MVKEHTLSKEEWNDVAEHIEVMGSIYEGVLLQLNMDGLGTQDADELKGDIMAAVAAIKYVAEFAADKCVFVGIQSDIE